jgi:DNA-binding SARP family transcriptional activator/tetratricopeptide (TPR) repeat protein/transcriptional regulator with XRE-family HTH domain
MVDDHSVPDLPRLLHQLRRREARRRGGPELTYRELAAKTGWSLGIIAQYFSGKTLPPVDRFDALVRLLGASPVEQGELATARDRVDERRRRRAPGAAPAAGAPRSTVAGGTFRLLGPVQVVGPLGPARLVGVRQRALVGLLALNAGQLVAQSRLVDALWGDEPPPTAVRTLYSHVARIRRALDACGLPGVVRTQEPGYLLAVRPDVVDAACFDKTFTRARAALAGGQPAEAAGQLRTGLALWRGDALADARSYGWGAAEVDRLTEGRLDAQEQLCAAQLRLGEHAEAVSGLTRLLAARPGRERAVELLMTGLFRDGRQADALDAFRRLRDHLAEHLGVEPSPRLQRLHTAILGGGAATILGGGAATILGGGAAADPAGTADPGVAGTAERRRAARRPAQLPPRTGHFTGRTAELAALDGLLPGRSRVGVVSGPAGMGKTALAVQWASRVAGRFPHGQLFVDLAGHDPETALPVPEVLTYLLTGLGVAAAEIPAGRAAQVGLYRSALCRRRVLVLLDNAASADQVAALVPPEPSVVLVTSRSRLAGLALDHDVVMLQLGALAGDDALALLRRVLGAERVAAEPDAADRLVELCGRMPLALRIAAAKLTAEPYDPIAALAGELAGADRLDALSVPGDSRSIRTAFAGTYRSLSPPAAMMFRRLGQQPGPTFSTELAATLAELPARRARAVLDELRAAHLVSGRGPGRYRFHDLIGDYARACAEPAERAWAAGQVVDWYLTAGDAANRILDPARDQAGAVCVSPSAVAPPLADREQALAFLDAERTNLLPAVRLAAARGDAAAGWRLAYLLTGYCSLRGHWPMQVELGRLGLAAAQCLADPSAEALMRAALGFACNTTHAYEEALEHLAVALRLACEAGDLRGQGKALNNIALAHTQLGRLDAAMETFQRALALHATADYQPGMATALNNIGHAYLQLGRPDLAREQLHRARTLTRRLGLRGYEAYNLHSLGEAHRAEADLDAALEWSSAALAIRRELGERRLEADTLNLVGLIHSDRGEHAAAAGCFRQALAVGRELGDRRLEAVALGYLETSMNSTANQVGGALGGRGSS